MLVIGYVILFNFFSRIDIIYSLTREKWEWTMRTNEPQSPSSSRHRKVTSMCFSHKCVSFLKAENKSFLLGNNTPQNALYEYMQHTFCPCYTY